MDYLRPIFCQYMIDKRQGIVQIYIDCRDLTTLPALSPPNPDWAFTFGMDAEAARKVRRETLQRIVDAKAMIGGFHFPFPAFGQAVAQGSGYAFQPLA